jgi:RNA polymerase sigma factor (sigma-70 family)
MSIKSVKHFGGMENENSTGRISNETFEKAILDYRERIFLVILRFVRNRDDAKDLTQDVFIRAYRSRDSFRGDSSIYTWLYKIAINLAINHKSRSRLSSFSSIDDVPEISGGADPSNDVLSSELGRNMQKAIDSLPARQKAVFILRYYEDKPHAEIAGLLGITEGAVKAHYHQAIKKLRNELSPYFRAEVS